MIQEVLQIKPKDDVIIAQPEIAIAEWVTSIVGKYATLKVTNEASQIEATAAHAEIHGYLKQIESEKLLVTKPAREWVQDINDRVLNLIIPLKKLRDNLLLELRTYRDSIREAQVKEQARLQKLADNRAARAEAAGRPAPLPEAVAPLVSGPPKSLETDMGSTSFRTDWKAEIVNGSLLPREYLMPDETKINAVVRASKGTIPIPGVRIYSIEVPVTRVK